MADEEKKEEKKEEKESGEDFPRVCPYCGSDNIIYDERHGEIRCADCGAVIQENIINTGPEWRQFDHEQAMRRSRIGSPLKEGLHDLGLSSTIATTSRDGSYVDLAEVRRLKKWHSRVRASSPVERNMSSALAEIDRICSALNLPKSVKDMASRIYKEVVHKNLIRGRRIEVIAAATVYMACRVKGNHRTLQEISSVVSGVSRKEISRTYRYLSRSLEHIKVKPPTPDEYVSRFCEKLSLGIETEMKAREILEKAKEKGLTSGRGPTGMAAAAIYIASILTGNRKTQKEVATVAGVTEVTIRNRYKELVEKLGLDIST